ncbi:phage major capsid protein, partial [Neisseria sp. P0015.S002]
MDKNQTPTTVETPAAATPAAAATDTNNTAERGMQNERARVSELLAIVRSYAAHGGIVAAEKVIKEGGSEAQLRAAIIAK